MSEAYDVWVAVEHVRLEYASAVQKWEDVERVNHLQPGSLSGLHRREFDRLTKKSKKLRLLFAKGRKEGRR